MDNLVSTIYDTSAATHRMLNAATKKFPTFPSDALHAIAIVNEEVGELNKEILQHVYEPHKGTTLESIDEELIQSIAMLYRFRHALINGYLQFTPGPQHTQNITRPLEA
jgi:NTP pyrophosphatase (non-canonical NTP hydrolase)